MGFGAFFMVITTHYAPKNDGHFWNRFVQLYDPHFPYYIGQYQQYERMGCYWRSNILPHFLRNQSA